MNYDVRSGMWAVGTPGRRLPVMCHTRMQALEAEAAFRLLEEHDSKIVKRAKVGVKFNKHALWVGVHYSEYNQRLCVTPIPCVTFWLALPGGRRP